MASDTSSTSTDFFNTLKSGDNARHIAGGILLVAILVVIVWANAEGKKKVWTKENAVTALILTVGAFAVWNTPFVDWMTELLGRLGVPGGKATTNVVHVLVFFLVAISLSYWAHKWLWPRLNKEDEDANTSADAKPAVVGSY